MECKLLLVFLAMIYVAFLVRVLFIYLNEKTSLVSIVDHGHCY